MHPHVKFSSCLCVCSDTIYLCLCVTIYIECPYQCDDRIVDAGQLKKEGKERDRGRKGKELEEREREYGEFNCSVLFNNQCKCL